MDLSWLVEFLIVVVILSVAFAIIKYLIMPAVAPAAVPYVWAIIGVLMLIALIAIFAGSGGSLFNHHAVTVH